MGDQERRDRAKPVAVGRPRRAMSRSARIRAERGRRRRRIATGVATGLLLLIVVAAVFLGARLWYGVPAEDYTGEGKTDVIVAVPPGDSTQRIAETLHKNNVVATTSAFIRAAGTKTFQPGYYLMRTEIPAAAAVQRLTDPNFTYRVGRVTIPPGSQLDDVTDAKTNVTTPGIFTRISQATCVDLNGNKHCVTADDLRKAAAASPLSALLVPSWATERVTAMGDDYRRIEGLIVADTWDVDPSASAEQILATLIGHGTTAYTQSGLQDTATALQMSPYDVLVVASLVQREANPEDFTKVARVIYNRLAEHRSLEFDSTVNYPLDRREVATTDADRAQHTPWNTYLLPGLPATPIASPDVDALGAAERPAAGDWLYFVTVDQDGTTRFTRDYQQHLANVEEAKRNGVLDSSR